VIVFKKLTFANFLSVGNQPVSIDLDGTKTTLVHGTNGSGKSTILDALTYALFNKPFRRVNLPQLINTQNKKGLLVEVEFEIGNNSYLVRRGMKPKVFDIFKNKELLDSKAADKDNQSYLEQSILKLSYKSFTQIVILGSSNFVPFMQLTSLARRECVEDFLDIQVFSTMAIMAKERLRGLKEQLNTMKGDISNHEFKMDVQEQKVQEMSKRSGDEINQARNKIAGYEKLILELQGEISQVTEKIQNLGVGDPHKKSREFYNIVSKLETKIDRMNKENVFFESNDTCPTCSQKIEDHFVDDITMANTTMIAEYNDAIMQSQQRLEKLELVLEELKAHQLTSYQHQTQIDSYRNSIKELESRILELEMDTGSIDKEDRILFNMSEGLQQMENELFDIKVKVEDHDIVLNLLKDSGIKAQIVRKYLPAMNQYIRKYLTELELPIHFVLDEEFNESVSSPLHQNFSYASFSEGQKSRIDLALMLTWREIGKLKNSVTCNLLILDEVFSSSLDDVGKENLLAILRYQLSDDQRVVVVDHTLSEGFKEKFDSNIEVQLKGGFSVYN